MFTYEVNPFHYVGKKTPTEQNKKQLRGQILMLIGQQRDFVDERIHYSYLTNTITLITNY